MNRKEYIKRASEFAARGQQLPQSALYDWEVLELRGKKKIRDELNAHIKETLSNEALAKHYGVGIRTIENVLGGKSYTHLL